MIKEIRTLALCLRVSEGGLIKLASDIAQNRNILSVEDLSKDQLLELYLFLKSVAGDILYLKIA